MSAYSVGNVIINLGSTESAVFTLVRLDSYYVRKGDL